MSAPTKSRSTMSGSSVEADLVHRRWLDPVPGLRPFEDSVVLDCIGGEATVDRLVDELYARIEADGALRPLFGRVLSNEHRSEKRFFAEWLAGPTRYSESAW